MSGVPDGWVLSELGTVARLEMGQSPAGDATNSKGRGLPLVGGAADFKQGQISPSRHTDQPTKISSPGDIILCIRATIGKAAFGTDSYCLGRGVAGLRPDAIDGGLLRYLLARDGRALDAAGTGTTFRQVDKSTLSKWPVPLPPLAEQQRIVEKLDALTARTARARADLDRIPSLAAGYRRAILSAALKGEDGSQLVRLADVIDVRAGFAFPSAEFLNDGDVPVARIGDISQRGVIWSDSTKWLKKSDLDRHSRFLVECNDVLVALSGATTGKSGVYSHTRPALLNQRVARLRSTSRTEADCSYVVLLCEWMGPRVLESAQGGAQPNISTKKIEELRIYWPEAPRRDALTRRIHAQFAELDRLTAEAAAARRLLDRLDQAVLAKAFRGELVPQDPTDEPASVLLGRIRAERAVAPKTKRGRKVAA